MEPGMQLNDNYVDVAPSDQAAVDLFAGSWTSAIPIEGLVSGITPLFQDHRLTWLVDHRGRFDGQSVLELGPLEGGHSFMLEQAGAENILAVEANTLAYLKCLVAKEVLGLTKVRFQLGNFDKMLETTQSRFDLVLASGVLYHLVDPISTLMNMMRVSDEIFIWSHFFDDVAMPVGDPRRAAFTGETLDRELNGNRLTYHFREYEAQSKPIMFCGGIMSGSVWLEKDQVIQLFENGGFTVTVWAEHGGHPHGPSANLYCKRG